MSMSTFHGSPTPAHQVRYGTHFLLPDGLLDQLPGLESVDGLLVCFFAVQMNARWKSELASFPRGSNMVKRTEHDDGIQLRMTPHGTGIH